MYGPTPAALPVVQLDHNQSSLLDPFYIRPKQLDFAALDVDLDAQLNTVGLATQEIGDGDGPHVAGVPFHRLPCPGLTFRVHHADFRLMIGDCCMNRRDALIRQSVPTQDLEIFLCRFDGENAGLGEPGGEPQRSQTDMRSAIDDDRRLSACESGFITRAAGSLMLGPM